MNVESVILIKAQHLFLHHRHHLTSPMSKHLLQTLIEAAEKATDNKRTCCANDCGYHGDFISASDFIKALEEAMGKETEVKPGNIVYNPTYDNDIRSATIDECKEVVESIEVPHDEYGMTSGAGYSRCLRDVLAALSKMKGI